VQLFIVLIDKPRTTNAQWDRYCSWLPDNCCNCDNITV